MSETTTSTANGATETKASKPSKPSKPRKAPAKKAAPKKSAAKKSKKAAERAASKEFTPAQVDAFVKKYAKDWDLSERDARHKLMCVVINRLNALARYNAKN